MSDFQHRLIRHFKKVLVKTLLYLSRWRFYVKFFSLQKDNSMDAWRIKSEKNWNFGKIFWAWLSKLHFKCSGQFSDDNWFWYKINSITIPYFDRKFIKVRREFSSSSVQLAFQGSKRTIRRKLFWIRFCFWKSFWNFKQNF